MKTSKLRCGATVEVEDLDDVVGIPVVEIHVAHIEPTVIYLFDQEWDKRLWFLIWREDLRKVRALIDEILDDKP